MKQHHCEKRNKINIDQRQRSKQTTAKQKQNLTCWLTSLPSSAWPCCGCWNLEIQMTHIEVTIMMQLLVFGRNFSFCFLWARFIVSHKCCRFFVNINLLNISINLCNHYIAFFIPITIVWCILWKRLIVMARKRFCAKLKKNKTSKTNHNNIIVKVAVLQNWRTK